MEYMESYIIILFAGIALLTIICQWISWRINTPPILLLLLTGISIGPVLHWFNPNQLFHNLLPPIISLAVAIILFEGSLNLNIKKIKGQEYVIRNLLTIGLLITIILTAISAHFIFHLSWTIAIILSAICAVSGPTVVTPMLRTIRPNQHLANILHWEAIAIDPIASILAAIGLSIILTIHHQSHLLPIGLALIETVAVGVLVGGIFGYGLGRAIEHLWIPQFLHNTITLCTVIIAFCIANTIKNNTGLLAVTLMGIWLANHQEELIENILDFKENLSILLISGIFIILSANMKLDHIKEVILPSFIFLATLQFIIRPLNIFISTFRSNLKLKEKLFLGWIYPRGIVAAAIAALFSVQLTQSNVANASLITTITFITIIGTVLFQSITANSLAKLLQVRDPEPYGVLIIGANEAARNIGLTLQQEGIQVLLSSTSWSDISQTKKLGLKSYYGHPISAHADRHLNLVGLGKMFGLSKQDHINALASIRYQKEFGQQSIYFLPCHKLPGNVNDKYKTARRHLGYHLFDKNITIDQLLKDLEEGATIKKTKISETFTYDDFLEKNPNNLCLFGITPKGRLAIFTETNQPAISEEWTIISLQPFRATN